MAKIYWRTIKRGTRSYASVPEELKAAVKALARADVESGEITEEQYAELIGEYYI